MSMTSKSARHIKRFGLALLLTAVFLLITGRSSAAENKTTLSATDAKILVYVSPVGESLRASGSDIAMEQQTSVQLNQADYYYFWVYDAMRQNGSVTVGYYAVNKYTGDVWDTVEKKQLSSRLLLGVQKIMRESCRIDEATIEKYRNAPF